MDNLNLVATAGLSADNTDLIVGLVKKEKASRLQESKVLDALQADGYLSTDFVSPSKDASTCNQAHWDSCRAAVISTYTKGDQKLIGYADTKGLTDKQKDRRRALQQAVTKPLGQIARSLGKREDKAAGRERVTASVESRVHTDITNAMKKLAKAEKFNGDLVELNKALETAVAFITLPEAE